MTSVPDLPSEEGDLDNAENVADVRVVLRRKVTGLRLRFPKGRSARRLRQVVEIQRKLWQREGAIGGPSRSASFAVTRRMGAVPRSTESTIMSNDFTSILDVIEAYKERWANPPKPGPLIVPDWLPAACIAEGKDEGYLERTAREYGFDGYKTVSESW